MPKEVDKTEIDVKVFHEDTKSIKEDLLVLSKRLEEENIDYETTAMVFAHFTKALLDQIDNKKYKEAIIRIMLDWGVKCVWNLF